MNWEEFNSSKIDITNAGQVLTDIRCPECGRFIFVDTTIVLASYPAQYSYWCACGWSGTSYRSWLTQRPFKAVVGFDVSHDLVAKEILAEISGGDAINDTIDQLTAKLICKKDAANGFYGAHINTCKDCELYVPSLDPTRGTYCVRGERFVCQHNQACEGFKPKTKEETDE